MSARVRSVRRFTSSSVFSPSVSIGSSKTISIVPGRAAPVPLPINSSVFFMATGTTAASVAAAVLAFERGASILRAHDVREHVEALAVAAAL